MINPDAIPSCFGIVSVVSLTIQMLSLRFWDSICCVSEQSRCYPFGFWIVSVVSESWRAKPHMTESSNSEPSTSSRTLWHQMLGRVLQELLPPVGISVHVGFPVMSESPEVDILLLRRENEDWTLAQLSRLPDGVRESRAHHIILEFKYTESINEMAFQQALGYEHLYINAQKVTNDAVQTLERCAKQTQPSRLKKWGYVRTKHQGVYQSHYPLLDQITLLSLNELSDEPHNAWVKCLDKSLAEKKKAFNLVRHSLKNVSVQLEWLVVVLWQLFFLKEGGDEMAFELTHEQLEETGKIWGDWFLRNLPVEEIIRHVGRKEILAQFKPEDILAQFNPKQRLAGLKATDILAQFNPADRLAGLKPSDRLAGLSPQEIEGYLKKLKQENNSK